MTFSPHRGTPCSPSRYSSLTILALRAHHTRSLQFSVLIQPQSVTISHAVTGEFLYFTTQLAAGCTFISSLNLVHMDLAARNVMLSHENVVKVILHELHFCICLFTYFTFVYGCILTTLLYILVYLLHFRICLYTYCSFVYACFLTALLYILVSLLLFRI